MVRGEKYDIPIKEENKTKKQKKKNPTENSSHHDHENGASWVQFAKT